QELLRFARGRQPWRSRAVRRRANRQHLLLSISASARNIARTRCYLRRLFPAVGSGFGAPDQKLDGPGSEQAIQVCDVIRLEFQAWQPDWPGGSDERANE